MATDHVLLQESPIPSYVTQDMAMTMLFWRLPARQFSARFFEEPMGHFGVLTQSGRGDCAALKAAVCSHRCYPTRARGD